MCIPIRLLFHFINMCVSDLYIIVLSLTCR